MYHYDYIVRIIDKIIIGSELPVFMKTLSYKYESLWGTYLKQTKKIIRKHLPTSIDIIVGRWFFYGNFTQKLKDGYSN